MNWKMQLRCLIIYEPYVFCLNLNCILSAFLAKKLYGRLLGLFSMVLLKGVRPTDPELLNCFFSHGVLVGFAPVYGAYMKYIYKPMETRLWFQHHMYMLTIFIVLPSFMKLVLSSSSSVGLGSDLDAITSAPCSTNYLSELYFQKHDSLNDFDFQVFLENELAHCSCNAPPCKSNSRVSVLQRDLFGEGSHRRLSTFIKLSIVPMATYAPLAHLCHALVVERLPSGVFADPFELQHLVQRGVFSDAAVFGDTNLELPSALSNRSIVEVHMDIGHNIFLGNLKELEIKIDLPLHARYPPLDGSGYSAVEMGFPDMIIRCHASEEERSDHNNNLWMSVAEIGNDTNTRAASMWKIPCGNKAHSEVVSAVTFIVGILSALVIVVSTIYGSNTQFTRNSKQS